VKVGIVRGAAVVYERSLRAGAPYVDAAWTKYKVWATGGTVPAAALTVGEADEAAVREALAASGRAPGGEVTEPELRSAVLAVREAAVRQSLADASLRKPFEAALGRRTFFHVKPLDAASVQAWRNYLTYEEDVAAATATAAATASAAAPGDTAGASSGAAEVAAAAAARDRVDKLYARALVACANYAEFWLRAAAWKAGGGGGGSAGALAMLAQAATIFLPRHLGIQLTYLLAAEAAGQGPAAAAYADRLLTPPSWAAGSLELVVRRANMQRRAGDAAGAVARLSALVASPDVTSSPTRLAAVRAAVLRAVAAATLAQAAAPAAPAESAPPGAAEGSGSAPAATVASTLAGFLAADAGSSMLWLMHLDAVRGRVLAGGAPVSALLTAYAAAAAAPLPADTLAMVRLRWADDADAFGTAAEALAAVEAGQAWLRTHLSATVMRSLAAAGAGAAHLLVAGSGDTLLQSSATVEGGEAPVDAAGFGAGRKRGAGEAGMLDGADAYGAAAKVGRVDGGMGDASGAAHGGMAMGGMGGPSPAYGGGAPPPYGAMPAYGYGGAAPAGYGAPPPAGMYRPYGY